jgi:hypothetical protein
MIFFTESDWFQEQISWSLSKVKNCLATSRKIQVWLLIFRLRFKHSFRNIKIKNTFSKHFYSLKKKEKKMRSLIKILLLVFLTILQNFHHFFWTIPFTNIWEFIWATHQFSSKMRIINQSWELFLSKTKFQDFK